MILSHPICKHKHAVGRLSIVAGKIFFAFSLEKPLPHNTFSHNTDTTISMELLIRIS